MTLGVAVDVTLVGVDVPTSSLQGQGSSFSTWEIPSVGAIAIVPSNDLSAAVPFWHRLGFSRTDIGTNTLS